MLFLNYDEIHDNLLPFWEEFLAIMDNKDVRCMGPQGKGIEKNQNFSKFEEHGADIFPLIEEYLTHDNSVEMALRQKIFFDCLKNAESLGLFASLENDPTLFNHEQSESFRTYVQSKKVLQECIVELKQENRRGGEINMNGFFIQLNMEKLQKNISEYENGSKTYALVDPLNYLNRVAQTVLQLSHQQCLKHHRGDLPAAKDENIESVLVEKPMAQYIEQRRNLMNEVDREIAANNETYMTTIYTYGKKR